MANGLIEAPNLDDRQWQDIVDEAVALIPYYNPEYTDHNRSDLGITLIELFAWLVEGMIYRLNRVPDKNFIAFLNLVGITRDPQTPATTMLSWTLAPLSAPVALAKGSQVSTPQVDMEAPVVFETDEDVTLLPVNLKAALLVYPIGGSNKYRKISSAISAAPLSGMQANIPVGQSITLALGFDQSTPLPMALRIALHKIAAPGELQVQFAYSQAGSAPGAWPLIPAPLDGTQNFTRNSIATVTVPATWTGQKPTGWASTIAETLGDALDDSLFWIGVRISNLTAAAYPLSVDSILFNSVHATSAQTITQPEALGTSSGAPFQRFSLRNAPLYAQRGVPDRYAHLRVQVREALVGGTFGLWTDWTRVEDFPQGPGALYRLDPVTGAISFGNHDPLISPDGHGSIPPREAEIRALTYRYVMGGARANVAPSTITLIRTPVANVIGATNPGAAANGADEESIDDAKRRGPEAIRNRFRAVTASDYEYLAQEASTDVRKVRCLGPRVFTTYDQAFNPAVAPGDPWTYGGLNRDTGNVQVIVIPAGPLSDRAPSPTLELLAEVSDYLEQRRTVTAALTVTGPRYLPIRVSADIKVWRKAVDTGLVPDPAASNQVRDDILAKIAHFLHPTLGNLDGRGWDIGADQTIAPLFEFIKPDLEVGFIAALTIAANTPLYVPPTRLYPVGVPGVWVKFADYEMVCSAEAHSITVSKI